MVCCWPSEKTCNQPAEGAALTDSRCARVGELFPGSSAGADEIAPPGTVWVAPEIAPAGTVWAATAWAAGAGGAAGRLVMAGTGAATGSFEDS